MPLFWVSLAFLSGILLGDLFAWSIISWLTLLGFLVAVLVIFHFFPNLNVFSKLPIMIRRVVPQLSNFVLVLSLILGAVRFQLSQPELKPTSLIWYNDAHLPVVLEGKLVLPLDEKETYVNLKIKAERIRFIDEADFKSIKGFVMIRAPTGGDWQYGDQVQIQGFLTTPPKDEGFSYRDYLAHQNVYSYLVCYSLDGCVTLLHRDQGFSLIVVLHNLRESALEVVYKILPDPEASLLAGIVLGVESGISEDLQEAFRDTGTSHIIVISGFNITILAAFFSTIFIRLLGKRRRFLAAALCVVIIALYSLFVGAYAAVIRAAILGGLSVFASQLGRRQDGLNSLSFAAAIMALHNPQILWDIGFQLSFAATVGLVLYAEPLQSSFEKLITPIVRPTMAQFLSKAVGEYLLFTLAAQLVTLPVILYHFQRFSLVSLIANPLVLPAQPPVMILGGLAIGLGMLSVYLGQFMAYLVWPFIGYTVRIVELLAGIPGAAVSVGQVSLRGVIVFYALLMALTFWGERLRQGIRWRLGQPSLVSHYILPSLLVVLSVASLLTWHQALRMPDGLLHITTLDVGSGDGVLIQTPLGRYLLIDGGPRASVISDSLGRLLPIFNRRLDYLIVAGTGEEQVGALPTVVERFKPMNVLWAGPPSGSYSARDLRQKLSEIEVPIVTAETGQVLDLGSNAILQVIAVTSRGAVLWIEWENFRALLPIGLDFESLESLIADYQFGRVTALFLADCGYSPLNPPTWISRWNPQLVLLSVAIGDREGRPGEDVLQFLEGYTLLRTDLNGWIHLYTDGERVWVDVEKR